jgi:hypothetical protein
MSRRSSRFLVRPGPPGLGEDGTEPNPEKIMSCPSPRCLEPDQPGLAARDGLPQHDEAIQCEGRTGARARAACRHLGRIEWRAIIAPLARAAP